MKYSERFKGRYFKAADLKNKSRRLTIASVEDEDVGGEPKVVIRFDECDQGLVLNKTNGSVLAEAYGDEMEDWVGKSVILKPDKTDFNGQRRDCIRVAIPKKAKEEQGNEDDDLSS